MRSVLILIFLVATSIANAQVTSSDTILNNSAITKQIADASTRYLSRRGYYIPIYTQCDNMSNPVLTLSTPWDLWLNYKKRHDISEENFRQLLSLTIQEGKVLNGICKDDFEYLYGRDDFSINPFVIISDTLPKNADFIMNSDVKILLTWAFDSEHKYKRMIKSLPLIAYRLMQHGILLSQGCEDLGIYYGFIDAVDTQQ